MVMKPSVSPTHFPGRLANRKLQNAQTAIQNDKRQPEASGIERSAIENEHQINRYHAVQSSLEVLIPTEPIQKKTGHQIETSA